MSQPDLFSSEPRRAKQKRAVPLSSRLTYQAEQGRIAGRALEVREWLREWGRTHDEPPTSAELANKAPFLACDAQTEGPNFDGVLTVLLYTRRGLSDLKAKGIAEHAGTRSCQVSGKQATTWRLKTR
jgi:hypothetical protein